MTTHILERPAYRKVALRIYGAEDELVVAIEKLSRICQEEADEQLREQYTNALKLLNDILHQIYEYHLKVLEPSW